MSAHSFWVANIVLSGVSVIVLSGLLVVYAKNFRSIKSTFSVGLVFFAVLFLIQNIASVGLFMAILASSTRYGLDMALPMLALNVTQLVGFGVLFRISWQ
jgi:hypothetical protein